MPNNYLSVLYKHIIQVGNKNVGLKVCASQVSLDSANPSKDHSPSKNHSPSKPGMSKPSKVQQYRTIKKSLN